MGGAGRVGARGSKTRMGIVSTGGRPFSAEGGRRKNLEGGKRQGCKKSGKNRPDNAMFYRCKRGLNEGTLNNKKKKQKKTILKVPGRRGSVEFQPPQTAKGGT